MLLISKCDTNGIAFSGKVLFPTQDPQIYMRSRADKKIKAVFINGKIKNNIDPEMMNIALDCREPRLTPEIVF